MKPVNATISTCRYCRSYSSEGRRGGSCQQLGVPVQGSWKACSLAVQPFSAWNEWSGTLAPESAADSQPVRTSKIALQNITLPDVKPVAAAAAMLEEVFLIVE